MRPPPHLRHEARLRRQGWRFIIGVDEAGRGPLAGPVVAAAVILPHRFQLEGLTDSKRLSPTLRDALAAALRQNAQVHHALGVASVKEIDHLNILRANDLAMHRAVAALIAQLATQTQPVAHQQQLPLELTQPNPAHDLSAAPRCHALVDGLPVRGLPVAHSALIGGDGISLSIAAASVLAKVERDRQMLELDARWPAYGFARHKGYGTREHLQALTTLGPCPAHRHSFAPVRHHLRENICGTTEKP